MADYEGIVMEKDKSTGDLLKCRKWGDNWSIWPNAHIKLGTVQKIQYQSPLFQKQVLPISHTLKYRQFSVSLTTE